MVIWGLLNHIKKLAFVDRDIMDIMDRDKDRWERTPG